MGFNTVILILNDTFHHIEQDPVAWWQKVQQQSCDFGKTPINVPGTGGGTKIIHMDHADYTGVYAVGGNTAFKLGLGGRYGNLSTDEQKVKLLRELARQYGYHLVKSRTKAEQT